MANEGLFYKLLLWREKAHQGEAFYPYYQLYRGNLHSCGRYHIETIDPFHTTCIDG